MIALARERIRGDLTLDIIISDILSMIRPIRMATVAGKGGSFYRQRFLVFMGISVGWFFYYFCRKMFVASMPELVRERGLAKTHLGSIASSFTILYGVSQLISGILSDKFSGKLLLSVGLFVSGICCVLFPCFNHVLVLTVIWGCNGYVQGFGWPGCANILKNWYGRCEIATWWAILSAAGNAGAIITPLAFTYMALNFRWENAFYLTGMVACIIGVLLWLLIRDSSSQHVDILVDSSSKRTTKSHSWYKVLQEFDVWVVGFAYAMLSMIRYCISDWSLLYFTEATELTETKAAFCVSMYQVGGVVGNILIGYLSNLFTKQDGNKIYEHQRAPMLFFIGFLLITVLHAFNSVVTPGSSELVLSGLQLCAGGLIEGSTSLLGVTAMDCVTPQLSGSSNAVATFISQLGAFFAGLPFGYLIKKFGWTSAFLVLESVGVIYILFTSYLFIKHYNSYMTVTNRKQK